MIIIARSKFLAAQFIIKKKNLWGVPKLKNQRMSPISYQEMSPSAASDNN